MSVKPLRRGSEERRPPSEGGGLQSVRVHLHLPVTLRNHTGCERIATRRNAMTASRCQSSSALFHFHFAESNQKVEGGMGGGSE